MMRAKTTTTTTTTKNAPTHTHSKNETVINKAAAGYVYSFEVR
jgi:hypothetical protein